MRLQSNTALWPNRKARSCILLESGVRQRGFPGMGFRAGPPWMDAAVWDGAGYGLRRDRHPLDAAPPGRSFECAVDLSLRGLLVPAS